MILKQGSRSIRRFSFSGRLNRSETFVAQANEIFTSNIKEYVSEEEQLTDEQLKSLIRDRPSLNKEKDPLYHFEIPPPSSLGDLIVNPTFKDGLITLLAKDVTFTGNTGYAMVHLNSEHPTNVIKLRFSGIAIKWLEDYKRLSEITLRPLSSVQEDLNYSNAEHSILIKEILGSFTERTSMSSHDEFDRIYRYIKFDDLRKKKQSPVTFDSLSAFLLDKTYDNSDQFESLLSYVALNLSNFEFYGLQRFTEILIDKMFNSKFESVKLRIGVVSDFMVKLNELYDGFAEQLNPVLLDRLAYINISVSNLEASTRLLSIMIQKFHILPKEDTLNSFLLAYSQHLKLLRGDKRETALRELYFLKPVFFQEGLSNISFRFLLENCVNSNFEIEMLLNLCSSTNEKFLIQKFLIDILRKFSEIQVPNQVKISQISFAQLLRRLLVDEKVKLDENSYKTCLEICSNLNLVGSLSDLKNYLKQT